MNSILDMSIWVVVASDKIKKNVILTLEFTKT